jgi:hypothetical protein
MATDEFISFDEAFELLCETAGVRGLGVQVQPGTMSSYDYDPFAEFSLTEGDREQHKRIRNWLKKIGFTDQRFPVAEFEKLIELFPDGIARRTEPAAVARARREALLTYQFAHVPWNPPEELTESILLRYRDEPRVRLSVAVNLMAFGRPDMPKDLDQFEATARRLQAAAALCDGPARKGSVRLIGSPDTKGGDRSEAIPPTYFDMPRSLGAVDESLYTDLARLAEECEGPNSNWDAAAAGRHQTWFNVRVDGPAFIAWLTSRLRLRRSSPDSDQSQSALSEGMIYTPDWELLAHALDRVVLTHGDLEKSKAAICGAVADRRIAVRVTVSRGSRYGGRTYAAGNVDIPKRIDPDDFDWVQSSPLRPWRIGPQAGEHYAWIGGWEPEPIELIELRRIDVTAVLRCAESQNHIEPITPQTTERRSMPKLRKPAPKSEKIEQALKGRGLDCDRQGKSYEQIAHLIGRDIGMGPTAKELKATAKGVERYFKRLKERPSD